MSALPPKRWRVGERVEVFRQGEGLQGGWFTAVLLAVDRGTQRASVRYEETMEDDGVTRLSEHVSLDQIRPVPPGIEGDDSATWDEGHAVEAWHNNAWWIGNIRGQTTPGPDSLGATSGARLNTEAEVPAFGVCLQGSEEQKAFLARDLRTRMDWLQGEWIPFEPVPAAAADTASAATAAAASVRAAAAAAAAAAPAAAAAAAAASSEPGAVVAAHGEKDQGEQLNISHGQVTVGKGAVIEGRAGSVSVGDAGDCKGCGGGGVVRGDGGERDGGAETEVNKKGGEEGGEKDREEGGKQGSEEGVYHTGGENCRRGETGGVEKATGLATILGSSAGYCARLLGAVGGEEVREGVEENGEEEFRRRCDERAGEEGTGVAAILGSTAGIFVRMHGAVGGDGVRQGVEKKGPGQGGGLKPDKVGGRECSAADDTCQDATCQVDTCQDGTCQSNPCQDDPWDLSATDVAVSAATAPAVVVYKRRKTVQGWLGTNLARSKGELHTHKGTLEAEKKEMEVERGGGMRSGSGDGKSAVGGKVRKREGLARQCKGKRGGEQSKLEEGREGGGGREGVLKAVTHATSSNPPSTPNATLKSPALLKSPDLLKTPDLPKPPAAHLTTPVASRALGMPAAGTPPFCVSAVAVGAPATPAAMPATPVVAGENLRGQRGQRGQLPRQLAKAAIEALQDRRGEGGTVDGGRSSEEVEEVEEEDVEEEEVEEVREEGVGEEMAGEGVVVVVGSEDEVEEVVGEGEIGCRVRGGVAEKSARKGEKMGLEEMEGRKLIKRNDETYDVIDGDSGGDDDAGDGSDDADAYDDEGDDDVVEVVGEEECVSIVRQGAAAAAAATATVTSPSALTTAAGRASVIGHGHGSAGLTEKAHARAHVSSHTGLTEAYMAAHTRAHAPHAPVTPANAGNRVTSSARVTSTPSGQLLCSEQHIGGVKRQRFFGSWHRQDPLFQDTHTHTGREGLAGMEGVAAPRIVHHASSGAVEVNEQYRLSTGSLYSEDTAGLVHGKGRGGRGVEAVAEAAYGGVLDALWVQGGGEGITWDKEVLLTDLRRALTPLAAASAPASVSVSASASANPTSSLCVRPKPPSHSLTTTAFRSLSTTSATATTAATAAKSSRLLYTFRPSSPPRQRSPPRLPTAAAAALYSAGHALDGSPRLRSAAAASAAGRSLFLGQRSLILGQPGRRSPPTLDFRRLRIANEAGPAESATSDGNGTAVSPAASSEDTIQALQASLAAAEEAAASALQAKELALEAVTVAESKVEAMSAQMVLTTEEAVNEVEAAKEKFKEEVARLQREKEEVEQQLAQAKQEGIDLAMKVEQMAALAVQEQTQAVAEDARLKIAAAKAEAADLAAQMEERIRLAADEAAAAVIEEAKATIEDAIAAADIAKEQARSAEAALQERLDVLDRLGHAEVELMRSEEQRSALQLKLEQAESEKETLRMEIKAAIARAEAAESRIVSTQAAVAEIQALAERTAKEREEGTERALEAMRLAAEGREKAAALAYKAETESLRAAAMAAQKADKVKDQAVARRFAALQRSLAAAEESTRKWRERCLAVEELFALVSLAYMTCSSQRAFRTPLCRAAEEPGGGGGEHEEVEGTVPGSGGAVCSAKSCGFDAMQDSFAAAADSPGPRGSKRSNTTPTLPFPLFSLPLAPSQAKSRGMDAVKNTTSSPAAAAAVPAAAAAAPVEAEVGEEVGEAVGRGRMDVMLGTQSEKWRILADGPRRERSEWLQRKTLTTTPLPSLPVSVGLENVQAAVPLQLPTPDDVWSIALHKVADDKFTKEAEAREAEAKEIEEKRKELERALQRKAPKRIRSPEELEESKESGTGSGREVVIQAFNWESNKRDWYLELAPRAADLAACGVTAVWLPPPTESVSPQGYMPVDLYNLNSCYGTKEQLQYCIDELHNHDLLVLGDVVLNHRCASKQSPEGIWNIFGGKLAWGPDAIVRDDPNFNGRGNPSSGDIFHAAPNIDHSQDFVRKDICEWLRWLRADVGYDGWRLDFARGFWGGYVKEYIEASSPAFCIGEYWDSLSYEGGTVSYNQNAHRQRIINWINATGGTSSAFDVTTKGILHAALHNEYWRLIDPQGKPPGVMGWWPSRAVTFLENHDTGSTQGHWPFPREKLLQGYAYILSHPGTPVVFYDHLYEFGIHDQIAELIAARKHAGVHCRSPVKIFHAVAQGYVAQVGDNLVVKLGHFDWNPSRQNDLMGRWEKFVDKGNDYILWEKTDRVAADLEFQQPSLPMVSLIEKTENGRGSLPTESTPLLPAKAQDIPSHASLDQNGESEGISHGHPGSTLGSAIFNLSNTIIGAGIMGLPATIKVLGIPLGLTVLAIMGVVNEYSLQRILRSTTAAKAWSFGDLMATTYGRVGRFLLRTSIFVNNTGILVIYLVIIGDVLSGSDGADGEHYSGLLEEWAGGPAWWNSRLTVLLTSIVTAIGPLSALPDIDSLWFTSGLSVLLAVAFVIITILVTLYKLVEGTIDWSGVHWLPQLNTSQDYWHLLSVIPTMATAFTCHYNMHPILVELKAPREEKMQTAIRKTFLVCTSIYTVTALFGYLLFGEATYADVLANFDSDLGIPGSRYLNDIVRLFYALHLMLVFPVIHFSLRSTVGFVLFPHSVPLKHDPCGYIFTTVLLLGAILVASLYVPGIQSAFELAGSTGAATIAFCLPGMVALRYVLMISTFHTAAISDSLLADATSCVVGAVREPGA
ncbi:unnamed protein product [Closterium sp. Naga37s-1]|nr:unnamed protein product [Closterium sp. Naga37s-1]